MTKEEAVREVESAALHIEEAEMALLVAIRKAHEIGASLRLIGEAAGMSHEQVRRLLD